RTATPRCTENAVARKGLWEKRGPEKGSNRFFRSTGKIGSTPFLDLWTKRRKIAAKAAPTRLRHRRLRRALRRPHAACLHGVGEPPRQPDQDLHETPGDR